MSSSSWKGKTRGGLLGYKIFIFTFKTLGISTAYALLGFVSAYYVLFAPVASKSSYKFFRTKMHFGVLKTITSVFRNFYLFGKTIIDKVAIGSGMGKQYSYSFDGEEHLKKLAETGGFIVSAHLGSWDIAGYLMENIQTTTHILMYQAEHEKIKAHLDDTMHEMKLNIIPIKEDMSHVFKVSMALSNKEIVCMHGDRFVEGSRTHKLPFLGEDALFPLGPFAMISKLKAPYVFAYAVLKKSKNYALNSTPIKISETSPEEILQEYVENMEEQVKENPWQWFNFYDFWSDKIKGAAKN